MTTSSTSSSCFTSFLRLDRLPFSLAFSHPFDGSFGFLGPISCTFDASNLPHSRFTALVSDALSGEVRRRRSPVVRSSTWRGKKVDGWLGPQPGTGSTPVWNQGRKRGEGQVPRAKPKQSNRMDETEGRRPNVLERRRSSSPVGETDASGEKGTSRERAYEDKVVTHPWCSTDHPVGSSETHKTGWRGSCWNIEHTAQNRHQPKGIHWLPET